MFRRPSFDSSGVGVEGFYGLGLAVVPCWGYMKNYHLLLLFWVFSDNKNW